jgi:FKBP-type peptidyl-prolyl cis-trans isomerase SlyD
MQFQAQDQTGQLIVVTVTEVRENEVALGGNHPLTGQVLTFDIDMISFRHAIEKELKSEQFAKNLALVPVVSQKQS